jgi:hypothetical protein
MLAVDPTNRINPERRDRMRRHLAVLVLTAALVGPAGCAATLGFYDRPHHEYRRWDAREDRAYRSYLAERHLEYRDFRTLDRHDQDDYWHWRRDHGGGDHDGR